MMTRKYYNRKKEYKKYSETLVTLELRVNSSPWVNSLPLIRGISRGYGE